VSTVDTPPDLTLDIAWVGALYLGDVHPSTLAATHHIKANNPTALPAADTLFVTPQPPWCGTFF
jgi:predicted acetyltransferase